MGARKCDEYRQGLPMENDGIFFFSRSMGSRVVDFGEICTSDWTRRIPSHGPVQS